MILEGVFLDRDRIITEVKYLAGVKTDRQLSELIEADTRNISQFKRQTQMGLPIKIIIFLLSVISKQRREIEDLKEQSPK